MDDVAMTSSESAIFGAIQGLTEYLPISSSAHLALLPHFLTIEDPGLAYDVFLHLGTLIATLLYFKKDWIELLTGKSRALLIKLVVATIPALIIGALFHHWIADTFRSPSVMVWSLSIGGIALALSDRYSASNRKMESLTIQQAVLVGLFQCLSLIPGVSRSGSTITAGRILGLERVDAARFSFLLSAPITFAAIVFEMRKFSEIHMDDPGVLWIGFVFSLAFGFLAIRFLIKLLSRFGYYPYAIYRVALAAVLYFFL